MGEPKIQADHLDRLTDKSGRETATEPRLSASQQTAASFLEDCLRQFEPIAALVGLAGTGKTTALDFVLPPERQAVQGRVVRLHNFVAGPLSLHRVLATALGVSAAGELSAEQMEPLLRKALAEPGHAEPPILAIDDAQSLLPETFRYLCLMAGLKEAGRPLFRILLVGRPGFTDQQADLRMHVLTAMQSDDAKGFVTNRLAEAGLGAPDEVVQSLVHQGDGNPRRLSELVSEWTKSGERLGKHGLRSKPGTMVRLPSTTTGSATPRSLKTRLGLGFAVPALIVVAGVAAVLMLRSHSAGERVAPIAAARPSASIVTAQVAPAQPEATPAPLRQQELPPSPPHVAAAPPGAAPPMATPPMATPPTAELAAPAAPPAPAAVAQEQPPPIAAEMPLASTPVDRFRVYNISQCHRGICPRWSVTNLSARSRFVASFDLNGMHLNPALAQKVRDGTVDLVVSGTLAAHGDDRNLQPGDLVAVVAHHGRYDPDSTSPPPPPQAAQSPPPGFLAFPNTPPQQ